MMRYDIRRSLALAVLTMAPATAFAQAKVGVMGLRAAKAGTVSPATVSTANTLLWQAATTAPGITPVAEPAVVTALGAAGGALATCQDDRCMASLAAAAGLDRVVYAVAVQGGPQQWAVVVRALSLHPPALLGQVAPTCQGCTEADCVSLVSGLDLVSLYRAGPAGAAPAAPAAPAVEAGTLSLSTKPPGARVAWGGKPLGLTPLKEVRLPVGAQALTLTLAGHHPADITVTLKAGRHTKKKLKLKAIPPGDGRVHVVSTPPGARVTSGDRAWGVTPLSLPKVPPGNYPVTVALQGYAPVTKDLQVSAGKEATLKVKLQAFGALEVTASHAGQPAPAQVAVDGKGVGIAPVSVKNLAAGTYEVGVRAPGLASLTRRVRIKPGKTVSVARALKESKGKLTVTSQPAGAEVLEGQDVLGKTPLRRRSLGSGPHQLSLRLKGYAPASIKVDVPEGKEVKESIKLTPLPGTLVVITTASDRPLPGTDVRVDGQLVGRTPLTWGNLTPGKHTVEIARAGVVPVKRSVRVGPGGRVELTIPLRVPEGKLTLTSKPAGAEVLLGEEVLGTTPLQAVAIAAGRHTLKVRKEGFLSVDVAVHVQDRKPAKARTTLKPVPPTLVVESTPPAASVRINGKPAGKTPLRRTDLPPGSYQVELELKGHRGVKRSVELEDRKVAKISEGLTPRQGTLTVTTAPPGAAVWVGGEEIGKTPLAEEIVLEGEHTVRLVLDRYEPVERRVMVTEGGARKVSVTLEPKLGTVTVTSAPSGAPVTLDGQPSGTTPATLKAVPLGTRNVLVSLQDYKPELRTLDVGPGDELTVAVELAPTDAASARQAGQEEQDRRAVVMWSSIGVGAALLGVGVAHLAIANSRASDLDAAVDLYNRYHTRGDELLVPALSEQLGADVSDADQRAREFPYAAVGWTGMALGAAVGGYGLWLLLVPPSPAGTPTSSLSVSPLSEGWGLSFSGALPTP